MGLARDAAEIVLGFLASSEDPRPVMSMMVICREMRRILGGSSVLSVVNTDLVPYPKGLSVLRTYARAKATLSRVVLRANTVESPVFLAWLFAQCDVSQLSELRLLKSSYTGFQQTRAAADPASSNVIDVTQNDVVAEMGERADFYELVGWVPGSQNWRFPATFTSLKSLCRLEFNLELAETDSYSALLTPLASSLDTLELAFVFQHLRRTKRTHDIERRLNDASNAIASLRHLKVLRLRSCSLECHDESIPIASPTVEILDVEKTGKHFHLSSVNAPRLRELHVLNFSYGNGLRRSDPANPHLLIAHERVRRVPAAGNSWYSCVYQWGAPHLPVSERLSERRVDLPDQCQVTFHDHCDRNY